MISVKDLSSDTMLMTDYYEDGVFSLAEFYDMFNSGAYENHEEFYVAMQFYVESQIEQPYTLEHIKQKLLLLAESQLELDKVLRYKAGEQVNMSCLLGNEEE